MKSYFKNLDNGRFNETKKFSKSLINWREFFKKKKLKIKNFYTGLSPFVWKIYDIQTRPFLKNLIFFSTSSVADKMYFENLVDVNILSFFILYLFIWF